MKKVFLMDYVAFSKKNGGSKFDKDWIKIFRNFNIPIKYFKLDGVDNKFIKLVNLINLVIYLLCQKNTIYFFRHPLYLPPIFQKLIYRIMRFRNNKLIGIIADLEFIRWEGFNYWYKDIQLIKNFNYIIVHNDIMAKFLKDKGVNYDKIINMEMTDYLEENDCKLVRYFSKVIIFAGNLRKSLFLNKLENNNMKVSFCLNLYGDGFKQNKKTKLLNYKGSFSPDDIVKCMEGSFGLVWDGNGIDACTGNLGEYMKLNNPHKLSMYIVSKLPVIVWEKSAVAIVVKKYNIGFTINGLRDIEEVLNKLTSADYEIYKKNVIELRKKIISGYHFKKAIEEVLIKEKNS